MKQEIIVTHHNNSGSIKCSINFFLTMAKEHDLWFELSKNTIEEMEALSTKLKLTNKNFALILLHVKKLLIFFFSCQLKHFKKYKAAKITNLNKEI